MATEKENSIRAECNVAVVIWDHSSPVLGAGQSMWSRNNIHHLSCCPSQPTGYLPQGCQVHCINNTPQCLANAKDQQYGVKSCAVSNQPC